MRRTIIIGCLLLLSAGVYGTGVIHILVLDWAGADALFPNPDGGMLITPADAIMNSLDAISADDIGFPMRDDIFSERRTDLPSFLDFYDIIYITLGWRGSGGHIISPGEQEQLIDYLEGNLMDPHGQRALIIEGCDFVYDYGDTSLSHHTYTPLMDYFSAVLKSDSLPHFTTLFGEDSSLTEGMYFVYPSYPDSVGPWTSVDDVDILFGSTYASHARYLFNMASKGPARGMQRRSYSPGTAIASPVIFGNLLDGGSTKDQLLYKMTDFSIPPIVRFVSILDGGSFIIDSTY